MNAAEVAAQIVERVMEYSPVNQASSLQQARAAADRLYMLTGGEVEDFFDELCQLLEKAQHEKVPPFTPGQHVHVQRPNGGRSEFIVDGCERAFGEWVVKGHFPREAWHPYIYPAELLEAIG